MYSTTPSVIADGLNWLSALIWVLMVCFGIWLLMKSFKKQGKSVVLRCYGSKHMENSGFEVSDSETSRKPMISEIGKPNVSIESSGLGFIEKSNENQWLSGRSLKTSDPNFSGSRNLNCETYDEETK